AWLQLHPISHHAIQSPPPFIRPAAPRSTLFPYTSLFRSPLVFDVGLVEHQQGPVRRDRRHDHRRRRPGLDQHDHVPERVRGADCRLPGNPVRTRPDVGGRQTPNPLPLSLFFLLELAGSWPALLSPAYNNPLICPPLGSDVGPGISPVTMLRWCRQPSPSKATLALFLVCHLS